MSIGKTPKEIVSFIATEKVEVVDLRFMDFPGLWQHFSVPARELTEEVFEKGLGFDGSSIRGWQAINESDMLVKPVADTAFVDPFLAAKTLAVICNICDPLTGEDYTRDPRNIARKAEAFLKGTGLADVPYFGPECEFFIFDDIRYDQNEHEGYYHIDSVEGRWNTGRQENPNLGYKIRYKEGYFPVPPNDTLQDIRSEMMLTLESIDIPIEAQHHEVATGGQCEIDMRFNNLVTMADNVLKYKYVCKNTAKKHGKVVTFMPSRFSATMEAACTCTSPCGRATRTFSRVTATRGSPRWPSTQSAGCSSTRRRSSPSRPRRRTASSGWSPGSRRP